MEHPSFELTHLIRSALMGLDLTPCVLDDEDRAANLESAKTAISVLSRLIRAREKLASGVASLAAVAGGTQLRAAYFYADGAPVEVYTSASEVVLASVKELLAHARLELDTVDGEIARMLGAMGNP